MGGRLALQALAGNPDFWDVAIVISAHPGLKSAEERGLRRERDATWAKRIREESWEEFLQAWNGQSVLAGSGPAPHQADLGSRREEIARAFENWSLGCQADLRTDLSRCAAKILWVVGAEDRKFVSLGREMQSMLQSGELIEIPDSGHRVLQERPEVVRGAVLRCVGEMGP